MLAALRELDAAGEERRAADRAADELDAHIRRNYNVTEEERWRLRYAALAADRRCARALQRYSRACDDSTTAEEWRSMSSEEHMDAMRVARGSV